MTARWSQSVPASDWPRLTDQEMERCLTVYNNNNNLPEKSFNGSSGRWIRFQFISRSCNQNQQQMKKLINPRSLIECRIMTDVSLFLKVLLTTWKKTKYRSITFNLMSWMYTFPRFGDQGGSNPMEDDPHHIISSTHHYHLPLLSHISSSRSFYPYHRLL